MMPADLDRLAYAVLALVADSTLRAFVVASVIGAAILMLRRKGAAVRLSAWTVVLCAALALPVLGMVVPTWRWPVPAVRVLDTLWPAPTPNHLSASAELTAVDDHAATVQPPAPVGAAMSGSVIAAAIYLAGVMLLLLHAAVAWIATRRLRLSARTIADADAIARLDRHASTAGLARRPRLVESAQLFVPVTMSVVRPIVALPDDWRDWPAGRLDAVLAHEVAHVARRDALTQRMALFYRAIFWCSPLSWWLHGHLSALAEQASDEAALGAGVDPTTYAETLLDCFARLQRGPRRADWHVAMARRVDADAARRVERILSWKRGAIMSRSKYWLAGIVLMAAPLAALTASVRPAPSSTPPVALASLPAAPSLVVTAPPVVPAIRTARPVDARPAVSTPVKVSPPAPEPVPVPVPQQSNGQAVLPVSDDEFNSGSYASDAQGVVAPRVLTQFSPKYTANAMRAKIQGSVEIEAIVMPNGTVGKARIRQSLDRVWGLDEEALITAGRWTFVPGSLNDENVPVRVIFILEFRLH